MVTILGTTLLLLFFVDNLGANLMDSKMNLNPK